MRSGSFVDVWRTMESFLDQARVQHVRRFSPTSSGTGCTQRNATTKTGHHHRYCLLCSPKKHAVRHAFTKLRPLSGGFVDISFAQMDNGTDCNQTFNGTTVDSSIDGTGSWASGSKEVKYKFPHVVGFYEVDSKKHFPKDAKKNNLSIEYLKAAIARLARHRHSSRTLTGIKNWSDGVGIPLNWLSFIQHLASIKEKAPNLPCISYEDIVAIARSFEIHSTQVTISVFVASLCSYVSYR